MERQYIITERAHLMSPDMEFGIFFTVKSRYEYKQVEDTIDSLAYFGHSFMRARIKDDENGKPYYEILPRPELICKEMPQKSSYIEDFKAERNKGWDAYHEPLLKVLLYPGSEDFGVLFIAHHLLCDGRGLMGLCMEFANCYSENAEPLHSCERLISSYEDFPKGSRLPFISRAVVSDANMRWKREHKKLSYNEFLEFEEKYISKKDLIIKNDTYTGKKLDEFYSICKSLNVSVNDFLVAQMMLIKKTNKVIVAADIRDKLSSYNKGSLGNYSTAFLVKASKKTGDVNNLAKEISRNIKKTMSSPAKLMLVLACYLEMEPELIDAAPASASGEFSSNAGDFVGSKMFGYSSLDKDGNCYSVSNLGRFESGYMKEAVFIPPFTPANKEIWGVVTVNGVMNICAVCIAN